MPLFHDMTKGAELNKRNRQKTCLFRFISITIIVSV